MIQKYAATKLMERDHKSTTADIRVFNFIAESKYHI